MYREVEAGCEMHEARLPLPHLLAAPAFHGVLIDRQCLVGHHEFLADAEHASETLARRAGAVGIVEVEHQVAGFAELDSVGREFAREAMFVCAVRAPHLDDRLVAAFEIGGLDRVGEARDLVLVVRDGEPVDEQAPARRIDLLALCEQVGDHHEVAVVLEPRVSLLLQHLELLQGRASVGHAQACEHGDPRPLWV